MTYRNRVLSLSVLLGVLVALYVFGLARLGSRGAEQDSLVAEGALETVTGIEVVDADGNDLRIEGGEGAWQLRLGGELYPARPERVDSMINAVENLRRNRTVSESAERHEQLGLTTDTATRLTLRRGTAPEISLLFGNLAPQGGEVFVRYAGEETAYAVENALNFYFNQETGYWAELRLVRDVIPENIVEISVDAEVALLDPAQPVSADYRLTRGAGDEWNLSPGPGGDLDESAVERIAGALANLQASDYLVNPPSGLFDEVQATVSFTTESGEGYRFVVGRELPENQFALRGEGPAVPRSEEGDALVFQIGAWSLERILKDIEDLRPEPEGAEAEQ
ncbi:MAG: DUF4340 domain-containing protein [Spirochaetaceae bacterium]